MSGIMLRELREESEYTCDWGGCDEVAVAERATDPLWPGHDSFPWLSACERHAGYPSRPPRGAAPRARCPGCGRERALDKARRFWLHRNGLETCAWSRTAPPASGDA